MHLHKYLVLLHEVLTVQSDVRSVAACNQLTRTQALKHCKKTTLKAIFHEFLHKKKRCSLPDCCISLEQRTSYSHRHPYKPLPPGATYQKMTKFDFSASCQLHFQGLLHCRHVGTLEPSWISWSTTRWPVGYTLLFNQRCEGALWQFETVLDAFFTICSHSPK